VFLNFYKCIFKANERCSSAVLLHARVTRIFGTHTAVTSFLLRGAAKSRVV